MLRFRSLQPFVRITSSVGLLPPALSSHPLQVQSTVIPLNASLCVRRFGWFSSAPAAAAAAPASASAASATAAPVSAASASMGSSSAVAAAPVAAAPVTQVVEIAADSAAAAASSATPVNVASAASGIGWPTDWLEALLSSMHTAAGLPWWATIACATLIFRSAMFPLVVKQMKNIGQVMCALLHDPCDGVLLSDLQMAKLRPEMEALQASVKGAGNMFSNPAATEAHTDKLKLLFKKHDVHPLKSFLGMFAQAPLFITFFWTLQNMAERNVSFTTGGFGQFLDLRCLVLHPRDASPKTPAAVPPTLPDGMSCRSSPGQPSWPTWSAGARCRWTTRRRRSRRR
jgi:membrane protein insertase Oxa1/YidC/SpoIIIJ